jgi:hypothetical protein
MSKGRGGGRGGGGDGNSECGQPTPKRVSSTHATCAARSAPPEDAPKEATAVNVTAGHAAVNAT